MNYLKKHFFVIIIALTFSCKKPATIEKWDKATIDNKISRNKIYKELDKQNDIPNHFSKNTTVTKKSSGVSYYYGERINLNDKYSKYYNCEANFLLSDTLKIDIGYVGGYSGSGFIIKLKNDKFYTEAYSYDDVVYEDETKSTYNLIYQKLILDKQNYKVGDSLYGNIEFKSIETDHKNNRIQHFGKGYFRTKIKGL
ncbi:hypothetical protein EYY60_05535 [Flavobacterium zhairuonense]|uniref:hypothetical protein n=1 Tax=Flavobacterium zhairuonense TaxID=2493631 RepID=UPI001051F71F|nr:hypothetical protein [Flavobacterium zhairuonense]KAF2513688.1 hypothetical protein EYY60_05535 [Flavobacterium zhairuonense]